MLAHRMLNEFNVSSLSVSADYSSIISELTDKDSLYNNLIKLLRDDLTDINKSESPEKFIDEFINTYLCCNGVHLSYEIQEKKEYLAYFSCQITLSIIPTQCGISLINDLQYCEMGNEVDEFEFKKNKWHPLDFGLSLLIHSCLSAPNIMITCNFEDEMHEYIKSRGFDLANTLYNDNEDHDIGIFTAKTDHIKEVLDKIYQTKK